MSEPPLHILFHPLECQKRSSTGRLLSRACHTPHAIWHRLKNDALEQKYRKTYLLYPESNQSVQHLPDDTQLLLLDATWQQSRKMLKQSPWLTQLPRVSLQNSTTSHFSLRRNQREHGLSTIEAYAQALFELGNEQISQDLLQFFQLFQHRYMDARQRGLFK